MSSLREAAAEASPREEAAVARASQARSAWREAGEASAAPTKKARSEAGEAEAASAPQLGRPQPWLPPGRYNNDLWTEVAKHLSGSNLIRLSGTCRWLRDILTDDSIWCYACYRDLNLLGSDSTLPAMKSVPHRHRYWHLLYVAIFRSHEMVDNGMKLDLGEVRTSGFLVEGDVLATARLPVPKLPLMHADSIRHGIELTGTCLLTNVYRGLWIAEMEVIRCPGCSIARCTGSKQVLDVRHCDMLLLPEEIQRGSFEHEDMGHYCIDKDIPNAFCAIINSLRMDSASTAGLLNVTSWIGDSKDRKSMAQSCPYAAALNSSLDTNKGLLSVFEVIRDLKKERQVVWIKISQVII